MGKVDWISDLLHRFHLHDLYLYIQLLQTMIICLDYGYSTTLEFNHNLLVRYSFNYTGTTPVYAVGLLFWVNDKGQASPRWVIHDMPSQ